MVEDGVVAADKLTSPVAPNPGHIRRRGFDFTENAVLLGKGTRITVRLPIDGESGGHRPSDPIKLVTERAKELATVANVRIKKSA